ncbi:hypothetical protein JQ595_07550 [Bradyrhizobium japonicum]|uniref:hypothetical protein n=1 Tax=Bradyrhizobium japonicum TaxID=375 RepID=UPI001BA9E17B|nr:hypothetical protein [Bradyrhizobium japonicum]MBR0728605.1 hypothetical protein [Bradyrhizobium japonicum]
MTGVVHDWLLELVENYPDLFHPVGNLSAAQGWPFVDDGWRGLLARAYARIRTAVPTRGETFRATRIKEKFGTPFYWDGETRWPVVIKPHLQKMRIEERIVAGGVSFGAVAAIA